MSSQTRRALALVALVGLVVAACGGSDSEAPTPSSGAAEGPASTLAPVDPAPLPASAPFSTEGDPDRVVQAGDAISVHYVGTLDDGEQFDSSRDRGQPLAFVVAAEQMIPGFDAAVHGMTLGDVKTVRIEPADAYGVWTEDRLLTVPIGDVPPGTSVGDELTGGGQRFLVLAVTPTEVSLDGNHSLAGEALTFEIELVSFDN